jgi:GTP-binding protein
MATLNVNKADFVKSAAAAGQFIHSSVPKVAFAGKSNVGKSSVINRMLNRKNFARVGAQPGKTVHINYFLVDKTAYFTDLPGYGFAKVSKSERDRWGALMEAFFAEQGLITLGVMIVDARHKPTADDVTMAAWFRETGCPMVIVANKLDKLAKREIEGNMQCIRETLALDDSAVLIPFSAEKKTGREQLLAEIMRFV